MTYSDYRIIGRSMETAIIPNIIEVGMPIGDPGGGIFEYTTEGLPKNIFMSTVPAKDPEKSVRFYRDILGMDVLYMNGVEAAVRREGCTLLIRKSDVTGVDTGIFLGVDDPYDLHRRLIDEGVVFVVDPVRIPMGVYTAFKDDDGNVVYAIEMNAPIKM